MFEIFIEGQLIKTTDVKREVYIEFLKLISHLKFNNWEINKINKHFNIKKNPIICEEGSGQHHKLKEMINNSDTAYSKSSIITINHYVFFINYNGNKILEITESFNNYLIKNNRIKENYFSFKKIDKKEKEMKKIHKIIGENRDIHNVILYGAPGTGKSHKIEDALKEDKISEKVIFRTTFFEDYSYYDFIGQYKPFVLYGDERKFSRTLKGQGEYMKTPNITYEFISGVFIEAYIKAVNNPGQEIFLIIEEINRGNCVAIFGDFFQSLDRTKNGDSKYSINIPEELSLFLDDNTENKEHSRKFKIPNNLKILATMNTSDQSLFKMDMAFKRRWSMKYIPISYNEIKDVKIQNSNLSWSNFLKNINAIILETLNNEDKMIGQYFCNIYDSNEIRIDDFKDKVLHYLFFDVFKFNRTEVFGTESFSEIYNRNIEDVFKKDVFK